MKERVIVLDYSTCNVWVYNLPKKDMDHDEIEEWLEEQGLNMSNCHFMSGNLEINYEPNVVL